MKIVADQNIPFVEEAFRMLGTVTTVAGSDIDSELVKSADILLVRSVTQVNEALLDGSSVKFVATATIGRDHIDEDWLEANNIGFSSAPASNAISVAEWVITVLYLIAEEQDTLLEGKTLAIIGVGNIGTVLYEKAKAIGLNVVLNDPPKANDNKAFISLENALKDADYVSVHVPLTYEGEHPTAGMINDSFLSLMKDGAVFINAARGRTMVEDALMKHVDRFDAIALDVWPEEPVVSDELVSKARIASPHIAGYSFDGKCCGTGMIYRAATNFFFEPETWSENSVLDSVEVNSIEYTAKGGVSEVLLKAYDLLGDDARFRELCDLSANDRVARFTSLRKKYPRRYEFRHFTVRECHDSNSSKLLTNLGFTVE